MVLRCHFLLAVIFYCGFNCLMGQNVQQGQSELVPVFSKEEVHKLKKMHPAMYEKLSFDIQHGWVVKPATKKWLSHEQVFHLNQNHIKNGAQVLQMILDGVVQRHPSRPIIYLLGNQKEVLILDSAKEQRRAFNNYRKK